MGNPYPGEIGGLYWNRDIVAAEFGMHGGTRLAFRARKPLFVGEFGIWFAGYPEAIRYRHEAGHVICMDEARRARLDTDAGGEYAEEDAVCYLQIVLAGELGLSVEQICADMDAWGYTFRLDSALAWYEHDAADARAWLVGHGLLTAAGEPIFRLRAA